MKKFRAISALAVAVSVGWALPAQAQVKDSAAVLQELRDMRAKMDAMAQRIDTLETELATANAKAEAATQAAQSASATASAAQQQAAKAPPVRVDWKGAPQLNNDQGWSFKPRGRVQVDVGSVDGPSGLAAADRDHLGTSVEFRRIYLGFDGTMPGGFGYRAEINVADSNVVINDMYLTYEPARNVTLIAGNQKPNWGLEEMTSDLYTSMMERSGYSQAFGFERRVGLNAQYTGKMFVVQGGIFADDPNSLSGDNTDNNKSWSVDGRVVVMPKLAGGTLHLGGSAHLRTLNESLPSVRYRARPFVHTTDLRFVNTGNIADATSELGLGLEAAYIHGRFHATAESFWQTVRRAGQANPTFNGGYAEVGYLLTDDTTVYKAGTYDRIKPKNGFDKAGIGAIQVNARYDWLDLRDAGILGGREQTAGISAIWMPTDYVRFIANYGHVWVSDSPVLANGDGSYGVDVVGMRAQFDF